MAPQLTRSSKDDVTDSLSVLMPGENNATNTSQLEHRLHILASWFGDPSSVASILSDSSVLEIGCGQGDMTVPLAHFAQRVIAVDPASLDYGSPFTLGQAQDHISNSVPVGGKIQWVQRDPVEYMQETRNLLPDFVVLAHCIFYFASERYFADLIQALADLAGRCAGGKATKLLIAEWGMQASDPAAEAHVLAAKAQATSPLTDGNVRTVILPKRIREIAKEAGWKVEKDAWILSTAIEDGKWEVDLAKTMAYEESSIETGNDILEMERAVEALAGETVASMDVWTCVFAL